MCKRGQWWLGPSTVSHKKKVKLAKLYYIISWKEYVKGVTCIKDYLED